MSSFEQFKRSKISQRSNKSGSRMSFKSFDNQPLNLENVSFSTNEIVFQMQEGQEMLVNQQLKVANRTGSRLYFRIKSNNPDYYDIRPTQDILEINAVLAVVFRLNTRKIISNYDKNASQMTILSRFVENNAFEFAWGEITEQNIRNNETPKTSKRQIFKVRLEEQPILAHLLSSKKNTSVSLNGQQRQQQVHSANELKMYSIDKENTELQQQVQHSSLLTVPIIVGVAFLSFVIGYVSA